jgi:hypothetical protein
MALLDRAIAHYEALPQQSVDVPEWAPTPGQEFKVFFRVPTAKTMDAANTGSGMEVSARLVALCALDEKGDRLFSTLDYKELMIKAHPAVIGRIANAIMAHARLDMTAKGLDEAEKN